jgi:amidase
MLDCIDGPEADTPYPAPPKARAFLEEVGASPGRLRIRFSDETPSGIPVRPEIAAALRQTARQLEALGHDVEEKGLGINYRKLYAASTAVLAPTSPVRCASGSRPWGANHGRKSLRP